jgi:hypothetical protein
MVTTSAKSPVSELTSLNFLRGNIKAALQLEDVCVSGPDSCCTIAPC